MYKNINYYGDVSRFIESEGVPSDAIVVDYTWRFLNKNGTPDRRFNNNYQIPICNYSVYTFHSSQGLNEKISTSKLNGFDNFIKYLQIIGNLQKEQETKAAESKAVNSISFTEKRPQLPRQSKIKITIETDKTNYTMDAPYKSTAVSAVTDKAMLETLESLFFHFEAGLKLEPGLGTHLLITNIDTNFYKVNFFNYLSSLKWKKFDRNIQARFPNFVKNAPCQWANCDFHSLDEDLKTQFYETELFIVKVVTDIEDEARDIFIRLQSGLPLNAQEKRDAWPGGYTDFVLRFGGKKEITRYPGHNFFKKKSNQDRGDMRQLCAQIGMMFFEEVVKGNWLDIGTQQVDDYYYQNLDFDINSPKVTRFSKVLDLIVEIFAGYKGKKLLGHEAIHIVLLVNSLIDDYTRSWQDNFIAAFDKFREMDAKARKLKQGDFWQHYGSLTQTQSGQARTIQTRHNFFTYVMFDIMKPVCKDNVRSYGQLEREIIYYRDRKQCAVCGIEIKWDELEIHHLQEHQSGGQTTLENGVSVHYDCHPKGQDAINFYYAWKLKHEKNVS